MYCMYEETVVEYFGINVEVLSMAHFENILIFEGDGDRKLNIHYFSPSIVWLYKQVKFYLTCFIVKQVSICVVEGQIK